MSFSQNTMQHIVNYLVTRPYSEVVGLITMIAQEDVANKTPGRGVNPVVEPVAEAKAE